MFPAPPVTQIPIKVILYSGTENTYFPLITSSRVSLLSLLIDGYLILEHSFLREGSAKHLCSGRSGSESAAGSSFIAPQCFSGLHHFVLTRLNCVGITHQRQHGVCGLEVRGMCVCRGPVEAPYAHTCFESSACKRYATYMTDRVAEIRLTLRQTDRRTRT